MKNILVFTLLALFSTGLFAVPVADPREPAAIVEETPTAILDTLDTRREEFTQHPDRLMEVVNRDMLPFIDTEILEIPNPNHPYGVRGVGETKAAAFEQAAKEGMESTKDMLAKTGRASRLGERTIGHQDAGATSCYFILRSLASSFKAK